MSMQSSAGPGNNSAAVDCRYELINYLRCPHCGHNWEVRGIQFETGQQINCPQCAEELAIASIELIE